MISHIHILFVTPLILLFAGCEAVETPQAYNEKIVVEGFIEEGEAAVVRLSKSLYVPYGEFGEEEVQRIPIRLAKVTVTSGDVEEVLVSRTDPDHLLGWRYSGSEIKGVQGESYTLKVEYSGYTLTAETTIPPAAHLAGVSHDGNRLIATLDGTSSDGYYMLMARTDENSIYKPCMFGIVAGASLDPGAASVTVFPPMDILRESYEPTFDPGDHVMLRAASIDGPAFEFWSGFMDDVINGHNPIYPTSYNLPSNIRGGGLGIWYGFSASYAETDMPE